MSSSSETESESLVRKSPNNSMKSLASDSHSPKTLTLELPLDLDAYDDASEDLPSPPPSADKSGGISVYTRRAKRKKSSYRKRKGPQKKKKSTKKLEVLIENLKPVPFSPEKDLDFKSHEKLLKRLGLWDFVHLEFDREIRSDLVAQLIATFNPSLRGGYVNDAKVMVNRADLARALKLPGKKGVAAAESADPKESEESIAFISELVSNWVFLHDDTYMMPIEVMNWMNVIKDGNLEKLDWATMMWFMVEKELMRAPQLTDCYYASHLQCLIKSQKEELLFPEVEGSEDESLVEIDVKKDYGMELGEEVDTGGDSCMRESEADVDPRADDLQKENTELTLAGKGNVVTEHDLKLSLGGEDKIGEEAVEKVNEEAVRKVEEDIVVEKVDEEVVEKAHEEGFAKEDKEAGKEAEEERVGDVKLMDYEGCKEENDEPDQWLFGKGDEGNNGIFLRQCSFGVELNKDLGYEDERQREGGDEEELGQEEEDIEEEEEEEEQGDIEEDEEEVEEEEQMEEEQEEDHGDQDEDFHLSPKGLSLESFPSEGLLHPLEGGHMSLGSGMPIRDPLAGDFVSSRDDLRMPPRIGNIGTSKGEMSHEENYHNLHFSNKRFRMDGTWDNGKSSSEDDTCLEQQIQILAGKAMARRITKEQEAAMSQQILMSEVQQRDNDIEHLQKVIAEERNMKNMEVYRLDQELRMMDSLLHSYRSALRETRKAFADYRAIYPKPRDPVYKEIAGTGGLVISAMELEKQRLKQEEEDRMILLDFQAQVKDFDEWWNRKFTDLGDNVNVLANKLLSLEEEGKLLKESYAKRKLSKPSECAEADS